MTATLAPYSLRSTLALDAATGSDADDHPHRRGRDGGRDRLGAAAGRRGHGAHQDHARLHRRQREPDGGRAARPLRPRHARGRGAGRRPGRGQGRGARRAVRQPPRAQQHGGGPHEPRDQRHPVGGGQQGRPTASTSSISRSAIPSSNRPPPTRSCRRWKRPCAPASSWSSRPATSASIPSPGQVGYAGITSPGNAPSAITVGALKTQDTARRSDDVVADYSSRGPDVVRRLRQARRGRPRAIACSGPAVTTQTLYSLFPSVRGPSYGGRAYAYLSGTSMAAGVVSGSVALMIEEAPRRPSAPRRRPTRIKAMLMRSAFPMTDAGRPALPRCSRRAPGR